VRRELPRLRCQVASVNGRLSTLVGPGTPVLVAHLLGRPLPCITVPGAYHHVPLDAPAACATAIITALTQRPVTPLQQLAAR
jgi:pimeloyl-ACP methyl ester carboxylesterase